MRTFTLLFSALVLGTTAHAQTIATFDGLSLSKPDTSYVNDNPVTSGTDAGFNDGLAFFPYVYDTSYGGYWSYGFSYSNWTDSVTNGYTNQYSAKTAIGYDGSAKYAVAYAYNPETGQNTLNLNLWTTAMGHTVSGFYLTNSTYAYNSMAPGYPAQYPAKKFDSGDWFLLTVKGYSDSVLTTDSVNFYLADYRSADSASRYVVKTWQWVNLLPLGHVDSLQFRLTSSDTAGGFGMNTPAYFCMDNFTTNETDASVKNIPTPSIAKVYPNPTTNMLYVDVTDNTVQQVVMTDMAGKAINTYVVTQKQLAINTSALPAGVYLLQLKGKGKTGSVKFVKE